MRYAEHVKKCFGEEYVFEIGDWAVTTENILFLNKGTRVKIIDVGARGYDLIDEYGNMVIETGWDCICKE